MKIEDIEVGKWYWFSGANEYAFCERVYTKDDTRIVASSGCSDHVWKPCNCIGEAYDRNTVKKKVSLWQRLWDSI